MKKKVLAILLTLAMVLALLAGCGTETGMETGTEPSETEQAAVSQEAETSIQTQPEMEQEASAPEESVSMTEPEIPQVEYPLTEEPVTLTMWYSFPGDLADIMQEYLGNGKSSVLQAVAEKTGVNLSFMLQSVTTANDSFNLLVASGDYPDLFQNAGSYYTGGMDKAVDDEVLVDLTELLEENAPNYNALIHQDETTLADASTSSGRIVEINRIMADYTRPSTGLVIRQDWLDDLGMEQPTTLDDLHDVLVAFKNEKGAVEPLGLGYTGVLDENEICSAFDVYGVYAAFMGTYPFYVVDGQVKFGWVEDNFKEYLSLMSQWYAEGLIGSDYYIENTGHGIDSSKTTTGQCGVWLHDYFQIELIQSQMNDENADVQAIAAPVKEEGQTLHFGSRKTLIGGQTLAITTGCGDPELALKYIDFFFTDEGSILCNYGVEGEGMEYNEDGEPEYTELIYANPDHSMRETQVMYTLTIGPFVEDESRNDIAYSEKENAARGVWASNVDDAYIMPTTDLSADQASEVSGIMGDLMTYATGKITEFIIGSDTLDNWDAYVTEMESFNVSRAIEIYQEVYDAYMA